MRATMGAWVKTRGNAINPVGALSALGITSMILWCKLMGHTSGFYVPLTGLGEWANARAFWLLGILIAALACIFLPRTVRQLDAMQRFVFPLVAMAGAMSFALAFHQTLFDQKLLAMGGVVVSGFGYFWFISRFVLLLGLTQGIPCLAVSFGCAFVLRHLLLVAMDAFIPINYQVMVAIALPLAAIACLELARAAARREDARHAEGAAGPCEAAACAEGHLLWGIKTLPKTQRIDQKSGGYLLVMVAAVALLLSVARACSISGTWGSDHTKDLDLVTAVPFVVLYGTAIFALVYVGVIRALRRSREIPRFLIGVFLVMTGLLVAALRPQLAAVPPFVLDVLISTNDPFALIFFWSTAAVVMKSISMRPNQVVGFAGSVYAGASIVWVFLIDDTNAVSSAFVLATVYMLFALFMLVFYLKDRAGGAAAGRGAEQPVPTLGQASSAEAAAACGESARDGSDSTGPREDGGTGEALAAAIRQRCEKLACEHGLSPRETDVLLLMAQGRTGSAIQEELGVAASTVKTHTQHVYAKLEVGDRQELMDMVLGIR